MVFSMKYEPYKSLVILFVLSTILFIEAVSFLFCLPVAFIYGESPGCFIWSDPMTAACAAANSLGNTGPGLGTIGPMFNYSHMPDVSKLIFSFLMVIG
jgi:Trk-type K+ transport system membrane component